MPLVEARLATRNAAGAVAATQRAAAIVAKHGLLPTTDGDVRFTLATALWARNAADDRDRSIALANEARPILPA